MIAVIQRVKKASVRIDSQIFSQINNGLLIFLGVGRKDNKKDAQYLSKKIFNLRIFTDLENKMNLNIQNIGGSILYSSQIANILLIYRKSNDEFNIFSAVCPHQQGDLGLFI